MSGHAVAPRAAAAIGADTPLPVHRVGSLARTYVRPRQLRAGHVVQADLAALTSSGHRALTLAADTLAMLRRNGAHGRATVLFDESRVDPRTVVVVDAPGVETRLVVSSRDTLPGAGLVGVGGRCLEVGMLGHRTPVIDWAPGRTTPRADERRLRHMIAQAAAPTAFDHVYGPEHRAIIDLHHVASARRGIAWALSTPYGGLTVTLDEYGQRASSARHGGGLDTWGGNRWIETQEAVEMHARASSAIGAGDLHDLVGPAHHLAYEAAHAFLRAPARTVVE